VNPIANKNVQHYKWRINSSSSNISGAFLRFFNGVTATNPANIYITNIKSYKASKVPETGKEYYYIRNGQGDIIALIDDVGAQVVSYSYNSWGKLITLSGEIAESVGAVNPYRYRGYRYDVEIKLYYLQSRYYNPEWCRFINADAIAGQIGELLGHNLFTYVKNNPINMSDSTGFRYSFDDEETQREYDDWVWSQYQVQGYQIQRADRSDDFVKTVVTSIVDTVVGDKINSRIPDTLTVALNREGARHANSLYRITIPNAKFLLSIKSVATAGIFGLMTSSVTIYTNYTTYGFWEATGRSSIDVLVATASIGASVAFTPAAGFSAGIAFGLGGDMLKDYIWDKR
jgi:RHS repeat-associated protein